MPILTAEERASPLVHFTEGFNFYCDRCDLGATVVFYTAYPALRHPNKMAKAVASFTSWWLSAVYSRMRSFQGMGTVEWSHLEANPEAEIPLNVDQVFQDLAGHLENADKIMACITNQPAHEALTMETCPDCSNEYAFHGPGSECKVCAFPYDSLGSL